ncbi:hypothetical protein AHMF7605_21800 [Adhaeribacter arboris]|uniref:Uncharacterized protein n=1 Tax=Adhaeribacter arboris TaxID=2072846 RepID=A0A2T2YKA6_9BACT|nr:hypothetical protein [Adhaeribacter arboris]PSR55946.1 hypothetical protein AHMF7605_21800 [Adhaeribacter arboris]
MNQRTKILITGQDCPRLTLPIYSLGKDKDDKIIDTPIPSYKKLRYYLHKDDELDKIFYNNDNFKIAFEEEAKSMDNDEVIDDYSDDNYSDEDYDFDDFRYK